METAHITCPLCVSRKYGLNASAKICNLNYSPVIITYDDVDDDNDHHDHDNELYRSILFILCILSYWYRTYSNRKEFEFELRLCRMNE